MKRRGFGRKKRGRLGAVFFRLSVLALIFAILLTLADMAVRTQLNTIAASSAKNISTLVINKAVMDLLIDESIQYDDLVRIEYDDNKRVSAIKADSIQMNRLQALIISEIAQKISEVDAHEIKIALGALSGIDLLHNKGPRLNIKITLAGNATTSIENRFETGGINQTRHQIVLKIQTSVFVVLPSGSTSADVASSFVVAETIIVGDVPEFYAGGGSIFSGESEE